MEEWRDVVGYEGIYQVSGLGRVRRQGRRQGSTHGLILRPFYSYDYPAYKLYNGDSGKHYRVHRLVAAAFLGPCPGGMEVNHINGNRRDNRPENLEYVTRSENIQNALDRGQPMGMAVPGSSLKGSENPLAKLTEEEVKNIRAEYTGKRGELPGLAKKHGVTTQLIWQIVHRKIWTHVD